MARIAPQRGACGDRAMVQFTNRNETTHPERTICIRHAQRRRRDRLVPTSNSSQTRAGRRTKLPTTHWIIEGWGTTIPRRRI
jgi:hypothetical protein